MRLQKYHVKEGFLKRRDQSCPESYSGCFGILREFALNIGYINATNILGKINAIKSFSGTGQVMNPLLEGVDFFGTNEHISSHKIKKESSMVIESSLRTADVQFFLFVSSITTQQFNKYTTDQ